MITATVEDVIDFVKNRDSISTSELQKQFLAGYNWAHKMIIKLAEMGIIEDNDNFHHRKVIKK